MKVLVIDDDPGIRHLLYEVLLEDGHDVVTADNGVQALDAVAESDIDALILDLQMPIMDGRVFYRALRALPWDGPVMLLSARGAYAAKQELGAEDALNKPFDPDELVERIRRLAEDS